MHGPQNLLDPVQIYHVAQLPVWVVGGKAPVICRMPILGGQDEIEAFDQTVYNRYDLIPTRHGQSPARQKVILYVNHEECIHTGNFIAGPNQPKFRRR
jgi:hypothetical protein